MDAITSTPGIVALGFLVLGFLVKWLFGRAEKTLDGIAEEIKAMVATVADQAKSLVEFRVRLESLEREQEKTRERLHDLTEATPLKPRKK